MALQAFLSLTNDLKITQTTKERYSSRLPCSPSHLFSRMKRRDLKCKIS
ncbi:hypothetical protein NC652_013672 [Populus alba x Populus x berolinensis]|nr:hypothetical protein NC652_013672 [Populus alba x Populus x berolinensis]